LKFVKFLLFFILVIIIDQVIKYIFLNGFEWHSKCISLTLAINKGVAFSMFAFLGEYLKYIQLILIFILFYFFYKEKLIISYPIVSGILFGASLSNLIDRFLIGGVVDYVYWHCFFDFAIFNFADVCIDFAIAMFIYYYLFDKIPKKVA